MTSESLQNNTGEMLGLFSLQKTKKIGSGTTSRKVEQRFYYFAFKHDETHVAIQTMSDEHTPVGPKKIISKADFLEKYSPEQEMCHKKVPAGQGEVGKKVARGDKFRKNGKTFTAELEYSKALALDDKNVRANFGLGLIFIARGEKEKAREVFERVLHIDAAFSEDYKHIFNEFGMNLRKSGMLDEAIAYYKKSLALSKQDENVHLNLARVYYEKGNFSKALEYVRDALKLNPKHEAGQIFYKHLETKGKLSAKNKESSL